MFSASSAPLTKLAMMFNSTVTGKIRVEWSGQSSYLAEAKK